MGIPGGQADAKNPETAEIEAALEAWRLAWEETARVKNVDKLRPFYDPRFRKIDARRNLDQQMKRNLAQAKAAKEIKVQISGVKVTASKGAIVTEFTQTYAVPNYFEEGKKRLVWKKNGAWKILEENFREDKAFIEGVKKRVNKLGVWPTNNGYAAGTVSARFVSSVGFQEYWTCGSIRFVVECRFKRWVKTGASVVFVHGVCKGDLDVCKSEKCRETWHKTNWEIKVDGGGLVVDGKSLNALAEEGRERGD